MDNKRVVEASIDQTLTTLANEVRNTRGGEIEAQQMDKIMEEEMSGVR